MLGAGPGDPELITQRAARRLAEADVVLYDALVHPDLLSLAPSAELVFVGKRAGRVSERQSAILEQLIAEARRGRTVVRLKGGDPFLFGRGSEEAEALHAAGIPFEVVPGVASPNAVATYGGISLTHRDASSSVAYITATESPDKDRSSHDWAKLATATETLVIFMGVRRLESLMQMLIENGRSPDTPAAVVEWASLPKQRTVVATVATLAERCRTAEIGMPALTIVGNVVRYRDRLRWYDRLPLFGARVLMTRPEDQAQAFARLLRDEGAEPITAPAIRIAAPEDDEPLKQAVAGASSYDWVVFTSANGIRAFFERAAEQNLDARLFGSARVCAIGPATARELARFGIRADLVPAEFRGEAVAEALIASGNVASQRFLLPRAAVAREALPTMLRERGAHVDVVAAYRNVPGDLPRIAELVETGAVDVLTLTAPSTAESVLQAVGDPRRLEPLVVASIGPVTTSSAEHLGIRVDVTAREYTAEGLVMALRDYYRARSERAAGDSDA